MGIECITGFIVVCCCL